MDVHNFLFAQVHACLRTDNDNIWEFGTLEQKTNYVFLQSIETDVQSYQSVFFFIRKLLYTAYLTLAID